MVAARVLQGRYGSVNVDYLVTCILIYSLLLGGVTKHQLESKRNKIKITLLVITHSTGATKHGCHEIPHRAHRAHRAEIHAWVLTE